jgi:hypothetical protein
MGKQSFVRIGAIAAASVSVSFLSIALPRLLREFTHAGLEGDQFKHYYELFLPGLWLLLASFAFFGRSRSTKDTIWRWVLAGALAGYLSGLVSVTAVELFRPHGWNLMTRQSLRLEDWVIRLGYPVVALNWLVGLIAACLEFLVLSWMQREQHRQLPLG